MSAPAKKQAFEFDESGSDDSDDQMSDNEEGMEYTGNEEIQVDFEGRSPTDIDAGGIKTLLQQLFLKAHINLGELTDLIIGQNNIGSVVKQSGAGELNEDDSEEDDDDDGALEVFAVTTVINLASNRNIEVINQLRSLLLELSSQHATEQCNSIIRALLADDSRPLGLIINERFVNIPPQLAAPILESLSKEIKRACEKKQPFNFSHYIFICKLYKSEEQKTPGKKKKKKNSPDILWSNPEEEIIDQLADYRFEFCVKNDTDSALGGNWLEDDDAMTPYRRVLIISAEKLDPLIEQITEAVKT